MRLALSNTYSWPVSVEIPVDGRLQKETFNGEFLRVSTTRFEQMLEALRQGELNDRQIAEEVLVGWSGISDEQGQPVPFSTGQRTQLLEVPGILRGVVSAFIDSTTGKAVARKN